MTSGCFCGGCEQEQSPPGSGGDKDRAKGGTACSVLSLLCAARSTNTHTVRAALALLADTSSELEAKRTLSSVLHFL